VQHPIGSCTLPELKARAEVAYRQGLTILLEDWAATAPAALRGSRLAGRPLTPRPRSASLA